MLAWGYGLGPSEGIFLAGDGFASSPDNIKLRANLTYRVGDRVRVKTASEITATLDQDGSLDGLPFMPQMVDACGRVFQVSKRAHKLCDTVNGTGARRLRHSVFLENLRCDGCAFGGCEMECLIAWKDAWLEPADETTSVRPPAPIALQHVGKLLKLVEANTQVPSDGSSATVYRCQATQMPFATQSLSVWAPNQYVEDVASGNATVGDVVRVLFFLVYDTIATAGLGLGSFMRWAYDRAQAVIGGSPYPSKPGRLPKNARTPSLTLNLQPGELVKVRAHDDVLDTVSENLVNRGMGFHPEMVPYCDGTYRVSKRLRRIINEKTGQLIELKNGCLVLEGVPCAGRFTKPLLCPRGMAPYWREIWLERTERSATDGCP